MFTGLLVIVYTVTGGSEAVSLTQKWQMAVIFGGMVTAVVVLLAKLPDGLGFTGAAHVAGALGKLQAVDFSLDPSRRYTLWTGLLGGLFLSLSYFGTDQSQVQRYIGGASLREGRLGLMFNALLKIPMQFFILLLGALLFVFYQFAPHPGVLQPGRVATPRAGRGAETFRALEAQHAAAAALTREAIRAWLGARASEDAAARSRRARRHGRGQPPHRCRSRRGQGRPRRRRSAREDEGLRLRLHHLHPDRSCRTGRSVCWSR